MKEYIVPVCDDQMMIVGDIRWNPELIRCKDCVWHCDTNCALQSRGVPMHDNDFCSRAECRGEE